MSDKQKAVVKREDEGKSVEFVPLGASMAIRLTAAMVRQFIAVPTKSGALPSERDCIRFIMLCRGKRANPFEGDCFLIGYDSEKGPSFSLVCGLELFLKRAEQSEDYNGAESGVIVMSKDGVVTEREGSMVFDGEKLVGGWAKVYRKNHEKPEYKSVKFSTYDTGRSRWLKDPGGMIEKVAKSQALRAAYPTALGGLYTQEEMQKVTELGDGVMEIRTQIAEPQAVQPQAASEQKPTKAEDKKPEAPAQPPPESQEPAGEVVHVKVGDIRTRNGTTNGKKWTRYYFSFQGDFYSTFDEKLAGVLRGMLDTEADIRIERAEKGINILGIVSDSQEPPPPTGNESQGEDLPD